MTVNVRAGIGTAFRLVLAVVLLWAGGVKLLDGGAREAIVAYRVFPPSWAGVLGWTLPGLEVLLGLLLLVGLATRWAALATAILMVAFIVGISSVWIRGYSIDCGCFGGGGNVSEEGKAWRYTSELLRDFLFMGMAVWLVAWPRTKLSLDREPLAFDDYDDDTTDETETVEEQSR